MRATVNQYKWSFLDDRSGLFTAAKATGFSPWFAAVLVRGVADKPRATDKWRPEGSSLDSGEFPGLTRGVRNSGDPGRGD